MQTNSDIKLIDFTFIELIDIVKTIARTKKASSCDFWKGGTGLISLEHLESHSDAILEEIACRVRKAWSLENILINIKNHRLNLPDFIRNLFNINACELSRLIYKEPPLIGALKNGIYEEIFLIQENQKYIMKWTGQISIESIN